MDREIYDSMKDYNLSPRDFITLMFERTDEDGVLYIPGWHYDGPGWEQGVEGSTDEYDSYRCVVNWNLDKSIVGGIRECPVFRAVREPPLQF